MERKGKKSEGGCTDVCAIMCVDFYYFVVKEHCLVTMLTSTDSGDVQQ